MKKIKFEQLIFIIATIWYVLTAYLSSGYFHFDEHYQIIEFAGIKDGTNTAKDLTWEYQAQIRPAIQPTISYLIFKTCNLLSITNPYDKAFVLRLITSLLSVIAIYFFTNSCKNIVLKKYWKPFVLLSYFIWFLPFINVRFSSETWSGIILLLALALVIRENRSYTSYFMLGSLLGLSFLFRFQMAIPILGLVLWILFIRKESIPKIGLILLSGLILVLIGVFIDRWFYGNWTFTFWNYFNENIIEGKAKEFGTSPWYYYFYVIFIYSFFPFGILILTAFLILTFKKFNSVFIWTILPFLIVHTFISHKEMRFLFPIINLVPIVIILALQEVSLKSRINSPTKLIKGLSILLIIINITGLVVASFKPAGAGSMKLTQKIHELNFSKPLNIYYVDNDNPYSPWNLTTNFYARPNSEIKKIDLSQQVNIPAIDSSKRNVLIVNMRNAKNEKVKNFITRMHMKEQCKNVSNFMIPILELYGYPNYEFIILYCD